MNSIPTVKPKWSLWPVSIIAFFSIAILGCGLFVAFCSINGSELVASDYYEQEIRYQHEMECIARAENLDPPPTIKYLREAGVVVVRIPPLQGAAISGMLELYRPSSARLDRKVPLRLDSNGMQTVEAGSLARGPWRMKLAWNAGGQSYQMDRQIIIAAGENRGSR